MKKRLPRKEKKYAKKQGGYYQYSLCLYCRHNINGRSTSVEQPNGTFKKYYYKNFASVRDTGESIQGTYQGLNR